MNWKEKIHKGMELIAEGCYNNNSLNDCRQCPMDLYCDAIRLAEEAGYKIDIPETWREE